ncbi:MAG: hypothetical protein ACI9WU_001585 [Myxococcota bacterium]|jgi:hypothetical protein
MSEHSDARDPSETIATLREQHTQYDEELRRLKRNTHLTPEESLQVRRLKRLKLQLKDRIHLLSSDAS